MASSDIDDNDKETLRRILDIRSRKEDKLRKRLSDTKKQAQKMVANRRQKVIERHQLIDAIRHLTLPEKSLDFSGMNEFKVDLAKRYQNERELAEEIVRVQEQIEAIGQTIKQINKEIFQLVKDQEKLQAVFDE
ncbi:hypothetical protein SOPP22_19475 [Shewanella sp. OPT22]|nr:hypothetical protein SOPP22_19475 [Shewanella sp. OPT22]